MASLRFLSTILFIFLYPLFLATRLTDLAADVLGLILDTLALIRFWTSQGADLCCGLADKSLIDTLDNDLGAIATGSDTSWYYVVDDGGIAESKNDDILLAVLLELGPVAYAVDEKSLGVALAYAYDHVVDQLAIEAMSTSALLLVVLSGYYDLVILYLNGHLWADSLLELALWALDDNVQILDGNLYTCWDDNRQLTNT